MKKLIMILLIVLGIITVPSNVFAQESIVEFKSSDDLAETSKLLKQVDKFYFIEEPILKVNPETLVNDTVTLDEAVDFVNSIPIKKSIRLDPIQVGTLFPELTSSFEKDSYEIDYDSFIPILLQAYLEQKKYIEELELRISKLENSKN